MTQQAGFEVHRQRLLDGLPAKEEAGSWIHSIESHHLAPQSDPQTLIADAGRSGDLIRRGWELCARLPLKSERDPAQRAAAESVLECITTLCRDICRLHHQTMYALLTDHCSRFLRVEELVFKAAEFWPGIVPTQSELAAESRRHQKDKDGLELCQGIFFSQILGERQSGLHLLHAMLRPGRESLEMLPEFIRNGRVKLDHATVEVDGGAATIYLSNPRYLNAEDELTTRDQEMAIDLVLLHPQVSIGILRGDRVEHPRYKGSRVFSSGINLTKIYQGKIPFMMYLARDFGMVNKLYYGLAGEIWNENEPGNSLEKPWIGVIENFAIGGGCQLLLTMDYILAESGSYFNLPARKEGIIPGAANLRLQRFLGERLAKEAILFDRTFYADSPEAAGLINQVVPRGQVDMALKNVVEKVLESGMVSAGGNRKMLRIGRENLEVFRRYMANYAELQAYCHLSSQLVDNLEKFWNAKERKL